MMGFLVCSTIFDITITEHLLNISLCLLGVISVLIKMIALLRERAEETLINMSGL